MGLKHRLTDEERTFFSLVSDAALANPFGQRRVELDSNIAGLFPDIPRKELIKRAEEEIKNRTRQFEKENRDDFNEFIEKDKIIVRVSFFYDFFYRYLAKFDQLIVDQIEAGDSPIKVPFGKEAIALLLKRGFNKEEAKKYFALAYQLRRAFFFIDKGLIGRSQCMIRLRENLWNNVVTNDLNLYDTHLWNKMEDFSTMILGETGTGKGTAAMAIGRSGFIPFDETKQVFVESFTRSFVSLNLSQFSAALIESELFGHKKGAFTGAVEDHEGILNRCSPYGAIFLDEIGEVSVPVQIKLLKVLEERAFSPVGSHDEYRFQGRIIAATNRMFEDIYHKGILRDDFYYRLCSDIVVVPPLWKRIKEDPKELDDLVAHVIEKMMGEPSPELVSIIRKTIDKQLGKKYLWPGNVRELGQCVRRVLINGVYDATLKLDKQDKMVLLDVETKEELLDAHCLVKKYCYKLYERFGTYGEVARQTKLDRRTVKKHIEEWEKNEMLAAGD